jgi:uncharacterized protein
MPPRNDGSPEAAPLVPVRYGRDVAALDRRVKQKLVGGALEHVHCEVRLSRLPAEFDGLRIGLVTDLHFGHRAPFLDAMLDWIPRQEVDLWAVTGDLYEAREGETALRRLVPLLRAPLGRFAVPGNNDNRVFAREGGPDAPLAALGLTVLTNRSVWLERGSDRVLLAGTDDPSRQLDRLDEALARADAGAFVLLLSHSPDVIFRAAKRRIPFIIAGHTHGGQIRLPLLGVLHAGTRTRGCGPRMAEGAMQAGETVCYVSRGTGESILPFRFRCPGEVTTFTLRRAER